MSKFSLIINNRTGKISLHKRGENRHISLSKLKVLTSFSYMQLYKSEKEIDLRSLYDEKDGFIKNIIGTSLLCVYNKESKDSILLIDLSYGTINKKPFSFLHDKRLSSNVHFKSRKRNSISF